MSEAVSLSEPGVVSAPAGAPARGRIGAVLEVERGDGLVGGEGGEQLGGGGDGDAGAVRAHLQGHGTALLGLPALDGGEHGGSLACTSWLRAAAREAKEVRGSWSVSRAAKTAPATGRPPAAGQAGGELAGDLRLAAGRGGRRCGRRCGAGGACLKPRVANGWARTSVTRPLWGRAPGRRRRARRRRGSDVGDAPVVVEQAGPELDPAVGVRREVLLVEVDAQAGPGRQLDAPVAGLEARPPRPPPGRRRGWGSWAYSRIRKLGITAAAWTEAAVPTGPLGLCGATMHVVRLGQGARS